MVENNVNIVPKIVPFNPTEDTFQLQAAQSNVTRIDAQQARDIGTKFEEVYDFLIGSSGAVGPTDIDVHHRSIRITPDPSNRIAIPGYFTATINDATSKLNAFVRLNYNADIDLDIFYSYSAAVGAVTWDLYLWTADLPPGAMESPLDNIPNDFEHLVAIPINNNSSNRRYLIVALALP